MDYKEFFQEKDVRWYDVNDELPEEDVTVLVYLKSNIFYIVFGRYCEGEWDLGIPPWDPWMPEPDDTDDITHWMPLPWPPE